MVEVVEVVEVVESGTCGRGNVSDNSCPFRWHCQPEPASYPNLPNLPNLPSYRPMAAWSTIRHRSAT